MNERLIVVPEGMLDAIDGILFTTERSRVKAVLIIALRWLSEHPIVPTEAQWEECCAEWQKSRDPMDSPSMENIYPIWQRRMFLAPEPAVPEAIKDLLWKHIPSDDKFQTASDLHNTLVLAAYVRGQKAGK